MDPLNFNSRRHHHHRHHRINSVSVHHHQTYRIPPLSFSSASTHRQTTSALLTTWSASHDFPSLASLVSSLDQRASRSLSHPLRISEHPPRSQIRLASKAPYGDAIAADPHYHLLTILKCDIRFSATLHSDNHCRFAFHSPPPILL